MIDLSTLHLHLKHFYFRYLLNLCPHALREFWILNFEIHFNIFIKYKPLNFKQMAKFLYISHSSNLGSVNTLKYGYVYLKMSLLEVVKSSLSNINASLLF